MSIFVRRHGFASIFILYGVRRCPRDLVTDSRYFHLCFGARRIYPRLLARYARYASGTR